jgi:hypothetical protein
VSETHMVMTHLRKLILVMLVPVSLETDRHI